MDPAAWGLVHSRCGPADNQAEPSQPCQAGEGRAVRSDVASLACPSILFESGPLIPLELEERTRLTSSKPGVCLSTSPVLKSEAQATPSHLVHRDCEDTELKHWCARCGTAPAAVRTVLSVAPWFRALTALPQALG